MTKSQDKALQDEASGRATDEVKRLYPDDWKQRIDEKQQLSAKFYAEMKAARINPSWSIRETIAEKCAESAMTTDKHSTLAYLNVGEAQRAMLMAQEEANEVLARNDELLLSMDENRRAYTS